MERLPQEHPARDELSRSAPEECAAEIPRLGLAEAANDTRMSQLVRTIEHEIIPRLMLAHRAGPAIGRAGERQKGQPIGPSEVQHFARLMLAHRGGAGVRRDRRLSPGAARRSRRSTSTCWRPRRAISASCGTEDLCNFTDVTVGLGRLQRVLRELSPAFGRAVEHPIEGRTRSACCPCPGEQHTFGLVMVGEFFRRAGWDVSGGALGRRRRCERAGPRRMVRRGRLLARRARFICGALAEVHPRRQARNLQSATSWCSSAARCSPSTPSYVDDVGADGMTIDGREAPALAERLIARHAPQRVEARASRAEPA